MAALRYPCLVLDHDDTVVDSTAHVHYPAFLACAELLRPGQVSMTLEEYFRMNCDPGLFAYYKDVLDLSAEELDFETRFWMDYVANHAPEIYPGMAEIIREQKRRGGYICVVSHSWRENILRDYVTSGLPEPDLVYSSELPSERQKPQPWPLIDIMDRLGLAPEELLMVDDLPLGRDMARAAGVPFAAATWAHNVPQIREQMAREPLCFHTPKALFDYLFSS